MPMRELLALVLASTLLFGCSAGRSDLDAADQPRGRPVPLISNGRAGFIDSSGRIVIAPTLRPFSNWGQAFYDGLLSLGVADGPFLNTRGQKVLDNGFFRIWNFSEGLAAAMKTTNSKWGFVDHEGKFVIPPRFPSYPEGLVSSFSDGLAKIDVSGKVGYIDHSGRYAIPPQYIAGTDFDNGYARVVTEGPCMYFYDEHFDPCIRRDPIFAPGTGSAHKAAQSAQSLCKWRFIDKTGKPIFVQEFEGAMGFRERLAAVKVGGLWGFINLQGAFVISPAFLQVRSFSDGLALVSNDKQSGFIDKTGALKIPVEFFKAEPFSEGLAVIGHPDEGYVFIDSRGKQALPERFALASRFFHGLAHVRPRWSDGSFAYITSTGKRVFTYVVT